MRFTVFLLLWLGLVGWGGVSALADTGSCQPITSVPPVAQLGLVNVHLLQFPADGIQPSSMLFTVAAPFFTPQMSGRVEDLAARAPGTGLPQKFIISDGGLATDGSALPFVSVDLTQGSTLSRWIEYLVTRMAQRGVNLANREAVLGFLRVKIWDLLRDTAPLSCLATLPRPRIAPTPATLQLFSQVGSRGVSPTVHATGQSWPVMPLEQFVVQYRPLCIHEELVAGLILQRLGHPFQMVAGFAAESPHARKTTGHTWLRVGPGVELDVEWNRLGPPEWHPEVPGWQRVANGWGAHDSHWPVLVLE